MGTNSYVVLRKGDDWELWQTCEFRTRRVLTGSAQQVADEFVRLNHDPQVYRHTGLDLVS